MFNLVTGDDSIFYLNGWRWRWLGLGGVTLKDRNVLVSTGLLPLTRCVDHPPPWIRHQTPPQLGLGITPLNEWNLTRSWAMQRQAAFPADMDMACGVIDPGSGYWLLDFFMVGGLDFTGLTSCHLKQYFACRTSRNGQRLQNKVEQ